MYKDVIECLTDEVKVKEISKEDLVRNYLATVILAEQLTRDYEDLIAHLRRTVRKYEDEYKASCSIRNP